MLYAILVEGQAGPWARYSAAMSSRTGEDTDGDGLPGVCRCVNTLQFCSDGRSLITRIFKGGQVILPDPTVANKWDLLPPYQTVNSATPAVNTAGAVFQERNATYSTPISN